MDLAAHPEAVGRVYNVGSSEEITILDLAHRILTLVGRRTQTVQGSAVDDGHVAFVPYDDAYQEGFEDMRRRVPDTTRIRELIGWEPKISLDDALRNVIAYCREGGG